jgi:hypothetical protein
MSTKEEYSIAPWPTKPSKPSPELIKLAKRLNDHIANSEKDKVEPKEISIESTEKKDDNTIYI